MSHVVCISGRQAGTFDDVLDVGPVGGDLKSILWRAAGFHDGGQLVGWQDVTMNEGVTKTAVGERCVRHSTT